MQESESGRRTSHDDAGGMPETRVWWHALLELRGGRVALSLIVVLAIVFGFYLTLKHAQ